MEKLHAYYKALREPPVPVEPGADATERRRAAMEEGSKVPHAADLDGLFELQDTTRALELIKSGKTADMDGNIAELITKAKVGGQFILAPHLTHIVNGIFYFWAFP